MRLDKIDNPRQKRYEQRLKDFVLFILSATFCYFLSSLTKPKAVFLASLRLCFVAFSEKTTTAPSGGIKNLQIKEILL